MKILIVGHFNETAQLKIIGYFPQDWNVVIVPPGQDMLHHIEDCQVLIPEHIQVDPSLLASAKN